MHLKFNLFDVYNNLLVAEGEEISDSLIDSLIKKGEKLPKIVVPIKDSPLLKDLDLIFSDDRYAPIFSSPSTRKNIIETLAKLKMEEPLLLEMIMMKDHQIYTYKHVQLIAALAITIISSIPKSQYDPLLTAHLSFTHDIGKTRIPLGILNKETALTDDEFEIIHSHPLIGYLLLNYYCGWEGKKYSMTAYEHHEKLDGTGYPRAIRKIDPYAQLITPIDIFDALISDRPYRKTPFTIRMAVDVLLEDVEKGQLNKTIVLSLVNCLRRHKLYPATKIPTSKGKREEKPLGSVYGVRSNGWLKKD